MKIGIFTDLRFTELSMPTGVTKHIVQMIKGLYNQKEFELIVLAAKDQLNNKKAIPANNELSYLNVRPLPHSWHQLYWQSLFFNAPSYDQYTSDLDWVYCPKNDYLPLKNTRYAVTFHGAHELDPDYPNPKGLRSHMVKWRSRKSYHRMVRQAQLILTVSDFLKQKTIEWFDANPSKIVIVGNGVEEEFFQCGAKYSNNYYLSVGGLNFLDGGDRIIKIATMLKEKNNKMEIRIAGNQNEPALMKQALALGNIKLMGYLTKNKLAEVMSNASALLFLPRYETFGIAAAEAMAVGLPVITMKNTAIPEIVKEAGIYVRGNNVLETVENFILNKILWEQYSIAGKQQAQQYKWDACIDKLYNALMTK